MHTPCAGFSKHETGIPPGARYQVSGTGYLAPGTRYPAPKPVRRRGPNTEHRGPSPATRKRAHRVCMMQDRIRIRNSVGYLGPDTRDRLDAEDRETCLPLLGIETAVFRICAAKP
jgi:hypothetical protein